jgi:hypothetical protein
MKIGHKYNGSRLMLGLLIALIACIPAPAAANSGIADGGIIVEDIEVWEQIQEGEQIAVVRLTEADAAQVDLFVSLHDGSRTSHEIRYFVPLGEQPRDFDVIEEDFNIFNIDHLTALNRHLKNAAQETREYQKRVQTAVLVPGSFIVPGAGGSWAFTLTIEKQIEEIFSQIMSGLGPGANETLSPEMTIQTEHSRTEVYALDESTDLDALIATVGLSPAVQDTLRRYRGQRLAVITLQTQPHEDQGLTLSWASPLTGEDSATYAYPLGTGSAWSDPIEMTSIYVVSDPGVDFDVAFPRLGRNRSGYTHTRTSGLGYREDRFSPTILQHTNSPGYAVEQTVETSASSAYSHIWHVTYTQSNADEDIIITRSEGLRPATERYLSIRETADQYSPLIGAVAAIIIWITTWQFVMPSKSRFPLKAVEALLWAVIYNITSPLSAIFVLMILPEIFSPARLMGIGVVAPFLKIETNMGITLMVTLLLAYPSGIINSYLSSKTWHTPLQKTSLAYATLIGTSLIVYIFFALVYLVLVGGI